MLARQLKTPKGTRDDNPLEATLRGEILSKITAVFRRHGCVPIDTPMFELRDVLTAKYGEDSSKLIYDLADKDGGEQYSLRYDLTVPFARYLGANGIVKMKRYQIGKVFRRDQPNMNNGRLREFYQCDLDIAGTYDSMLADAEVLCVLHEILSGLNLGRVTIRLSHRKLLDGMFSVCGVPVDMIRTISSSLDKLDKTSWENVQSEMVQKGLEVSVTDRIGEYIVLASSDCLALCTRLEGDHELCSNAAACEGLADMKLLASYLATFQIPVFFDLSLARGLDYYTGIIFEATIEDAYSDDNEGKLGSVAAGGRYDNLVSTLSESSSVPCVGVSIGVERIFKLMARAQENQSITSASPTDVYIIGLGEGFLKERMELCRDLWKAGVSVEYMLKRKPGNLLRQFELCDKDRIPYAIILGRQEVETDTVKIRQMGDGLLHGLDQKEITVSRQNVVDKIVCVLNLGPALRI